MQFDRCSVTKNWFWTKNNITCLYPLRTERSKRKNSKKTKEKTQNRLFNVITIQQNISGIIFLRNVMFYSLISKNKQKLLKRLLNHNFLLFFCIFNCFLLTVSCFSFVISFITSEEIGGLSGPPCLGIPQNAHVR